MAKIKLKVCDFPSCLRKNFRERIDSIRLTYMSLCYNYFNSWNTVLDTAFEPLFWIVDNTTKILGPVMVTLVVFLLTLVVATVYVCLLPHIYYQSDLTWVIVHLIFGHWLLVNVVFNYFMAAFVKPGYPPPIVERVVSICKKCVSPKPPRTHHCTICGSCILKMDHHCPWLNNCVGFYNHRYFFLFVFYTWVGSIYVCVAGHDVFKQHLFGNKELIVPAFFFPINMAYHAWQEMKEVKHSSKVVLPSDAWHQEVSANMSFAVDPITEVKVSMDGQFLHSVIIVVFLMTGGVCVALGALAMWHALLISHGQTSIEYHINKKEKARLKAINQVFKNPYSFGFVTNWKKFFGLRKGRSFVRCVLLPSWHDPEGDGISWTSSTYSMEKKSYLQLL